MRDFRPASGRGSERTRDDARSVPRRSVGRRWRPENGWGQITGTPAAKLLELKRGRTGTTRFGLEGFVGARARAWDLGCPGLWTGASCAEGRGWLREGEGLERVFSGEDSGEVWAMKKSGKRNLRGPDLRVRVVMPRDCAIDVQDVFGPRVRGCGSDFDFTLLFEESILFILPLALAVLLAAGRCVRLLRRPCVVRRSPLYVGKIVVYVSLVLAQIAHLAALLATDGPRTGTTLAAIILGIVGFVVLSWLSALDHRRSLRPCSILLFYLFATLPMNIVRTRTLYSTQHNGAQAICFTVFTSLALLAFCVELIRKPLASSVLLSTPSDEERSSIVARACMWWITPLFSTGYFSLLTTERLPSLDLALVTDLFEQSQKRDYDLVKTPLDNEPAHHGTSNQKPSLFVQLLRTHQRALLEPVIPRICFLGLTFAQPFLVEAATVLISSDYGVNTYRIGGGLIAAYFLVYAGLAVMNSLYQQKINRLATIVRAGLVSQICQKSLHIDLATASKTASPTLVSAHVESIQMGFRQLHEIWANLASTGIALWLLYRQLRAPMFATLGLILGCIIISFVLSTVAGPFQRKWFDQVEKRVMKTSQVINLIKSVKMIGAQTQAASILSSARLIDIHSSQKFRAFITIIVTLSYTSQALGPALGLGIYSVIGKSGTAQLLSAPVAFSSLTLFSLASSGLALAINAILGFLSMLSCLSRIDDFLVGHSRHDRRESIDEVTSDSSSVKLQHSVAEKIGNPAAVECRKLCAKWSEDAAWTLSDISFQATPSSLLVVTGPTGCGKSMLLKAILGELEHVSGLVRVHDSRIGYCDHNPWVFKGTLRDNIVGHGVLDAMRYEKTLRVCDLRKDLLDLPEGDQTMCGSSGFGLSGGQKARVALARAIYAAPSILVLDDTFSGLDANTSRSIVDSLWGASPVFDDWTPTVIWATSSLRYLAFADRVIVLGGGTIIAQGNPKELLANGVLSASSVAGEAGPRDDGNSVQQETGKETAIEQASDAAIFRLPASDWAVYNYYFEVLGWSNAAIFMLLLSLFVLGIIYPQIYLNSWTQYSPARQRDTLPTFLGVYFGAGTGALLAFAVGCSYFILRMGPRASCGMHQAMLDTVLNAPMSFFHQTSNGVTINRFSQDLQIIDRELVFSLIQTMLQILSLIGQCVVVIIGSHYTGIAIPVVLLVLFIVQAVYLRTSRQLRILDIEARAPLVSHFLESLEGLATIRALGWTSRYQERGQEATAFSQQPFYLLYAGQILLEFVLDSINAALAIIVISLAVGLKSSTSASGLGLALFNIVSFSQSIKTLIQQWTTLEISLGAVSRVRDFTQTTEAESDEGSTPHPRWPSAGQVDFRNLSVAYSPSQPDVISNLTLHIPAGSKVAICGRSGSGKTTLVSTILRLLDPHTGNIAIDGVDLSTLSRSQTRMRLSALPQDGFTFSGTVRENLSVASSPMPGLDGPTDDEMISVLERAGLWRLIQEKGEGLNATVSDELLSHGQVQMFCFARLMLRAKGGGRVVVIDEMASSVDTELETTMQEVLRETFRDCTVIVVAHRLDSIVDFDQVVVMESARILETGNPRELLEVPQSAFARLYRDYKGQGSETSLDNGIDER